MNTASRVDRLVLSPGACTSRSVGGGIVIATDGCVVVFRVLAQTCLLKTLSEERGALLVHSFVDDRRLEE